MSRTGGQPKKSSMIAPRGGWREKKRRTGSSMVEDNDFVPKADNYTSLVLLSQDTQDFKDGLAVYWLVHPIMLMKEFPPQSERRFRIAVNLPLYLETIQLRERLESCINVIHKTAGHSRDWALRVTAFRGPVGRAGDMGGRRSTSADMYRSGVNRLCRLWSAEVDRPQPRQTDLADVGLECKAICVVTCTKKELERSHSCRAMNFMDQGLKCGHILKPVKRPGGAVEPPHRD
ncbi:hypothetical protein B0H13DRAFT_1897779 [Mycena leptocephala]|nr:hypothetical protein B0H13DRAFT_1897779 [Mycena leptocephala]